MGQSTSDRGQHGEIVGDFGPNNQFPIRGTATRPHHDAGWAHFKQKDIFRGQSALRHHWQLAGYIANLPPNRGAKQSLDWQPRAKRVGRRPNTWVTNIQNFTRTLRGGTVGHPAKRCCAQPCNVVAINA